MKDANNMRYKTLGNTGIQVSIAGFGVLTVGKTQLNLPEPEGAKVLRYALEAGINFIDTAQYYETYNYIRAALKDTDLQPVISSKCLSPARSAMKAAIEQARRELDRDVIDIFLLHEVRSYEDFLGRAGAYEELQEAKAKGIIRATGLSTHHVDVTEFASREPGLDVVFPLINLAGLGIRKGNGFGTADEMKAAIRLCKEAGKGVFAMKAFGGGNLTARYSEALDYIYGIDEIDSLMIGLGKISEVDMLLDYLSGRLPKGFAPDVSKKKIHIEDGNCEGCGACAARCPNHAISMIKKDGYTQARVDHSLCLTCGYCAPVCPVRAIILF